MASEFVDLVGQTQGVLRIGKGGTGNAYGWATAVITSQYNQTGSTWPLYSTLAYFPGGGAGGSNPQLTTTAHPGPFIGVVMGTLDTITGEILVGDVANLAVAAVQTSGVVPMLIDAGNNYGWFVSTGGGAADGHVEGVVTQSPTSIGVIFAPGYVYLLAGGGAVSSSGFLGQLSLTAGDGSGVVGTGVSVDQGYIGYPCTITAAILLADQVGDAVVDVWATTELVGPPTSGNSIVAAAFPTLASAAHYEDDTLTGWTTAVAAGTWFRLNVVSASTVEALTLWLMVRQT